VSSRCSFSERARKSTRRRDRMHTLRSDGRIEWFAEPRTRTNSARTRYLSISDASRSRRYCCRRIRQRLPRQQKSQAPGRGRTIDSGTCLGPFGFGNRPHTVVGRRRRYRCLLRIFWARVHRTGNPSLYRRVLAWSFAPVLCAGHMSLSARLRCDSLEAAQTRRPLPARPLGSASESSPDESICLAPTPPSPGSQEISGRHKSFAVHSYSLAPPLVRISRDTCAHPTQRGV
jgi:hypothetical protein